MYERGRGRGMEDSENGKTIRGCTNSQKKGGETKRIMCRKRGRGVNGARKRGCHEQGQKVFIAPKKKKQSGVTRKKTRDKPAIIE